jgi:hypothetical protein
MTLLDILGTVTAGAVGGFAGRAFIAPWRRVAVPLWLTVTIGVACAVAGSAAARMAGAAVPSRPGELFVQLLFAAVGGTVMAATSARHRPRDHDS